MKACVHFSEDWGDETDIRPVDGKPWHAWIIVYDHGKEYRQFAWGHMWSYLVHLACSYECRREAKIFRGEVLNLLERIEKKWKESEDP
jgi:hypothetical protein